MTGVFSRLTQYPPNTTKTVRREGPTTIAASVVGTIAPTASPIADAAKDSKVTIPQNFPNL